MKTKKRNSSRDVFKDPRHLGHYVQSSTWKRRLRRTARKHMQSLQKHSKEPGYRARGVYELIDYWKKEARNG